MQERLLSGDVKFLATTPKSLDILNNWGECMLCKEVFRSCNEKSVFLVIAMINANA